MADLKLKHFELLDEEWEALRDPASGMVSAKWLEESHCPVCASTANTKIFVKKGLHFVQCDKCTHVFINPQLKEDVLAEHFKHSKAWEVWAQNLVSQDQKNFDLSKFKDALKTVAKLRGKKKPGRVLDVGCSSGVFLRVAQDQGWDAQGVEPSAAAAQFAKTHYGLNVFQGQFLDFRSQDKFDLITFWASLEYSKDVQTVLKKAKSLLKDDGLILILISGNSHSLAMRMLQEKCVGFIFNRTHSFNPTSLDVLMRKYGFKPFSHYSILPETRVLLNHLSYQEPYAQGKRSLFSLEDEGLLEKLIQKNCMGYKFVAIYGTPEVKKQGGRDRGNKK